MPDKKTEAEQGGSWTVDKHIPLALLAGMTMQILAGLVAATLLWADVQNHSRRIDRLETTADALRDVVIELRAVVRSARDSSRSTDK